MSVRASSAADDPRLDAFVREHPHGTFFHLAGWREVVARFSGHTSVVFVAEADGAVTGVLPLFSIKSPLLGRALVSSPWAVYGGVIADDPTTAQALVEAARGAAEEFNAAYVELRHLHAPGLDLPVNDLYSTYVKDLPDDPDECLTGIPRKSRASARQARDKHGMTFVEGDEHLDDFYELFVLNKRALGSPVFSLAWFRALLERFGDDCVVGAVKHEDTTIAGVVSFIHAGTINPYFSGSKTGTERLGSMNFMYWKVMETAAARGLKRYDFGRSRNGSGAAKFKVNMGFEPTPLTYQYVLRGDAEIPSVNPSNPKFDLVKNVWSKLPVSVVKFLGPRLMKGLP